MKFITYKKNQHNQLAFLINEYAYDVNAVDANIPNSLKQLLQGGDELMALAREAHSKVIAGNFAHIAIHWNTLEILAPIPDPSSCRDGYAFRQHVAAARRNRKVPMIEEFDHYPIFYFTNHNAIQGPGDIICMPDHFQKLDFELEIACVIGKKGRNIKASDADDYIAGYTIMNDMSARTLQMEEMLLNLGPAKGKDFSTVIGPYFITSDELESYVVPAKEKHEGKNYNLSMTCRVNGIEVSKGNVADMDWTFAEIVERCAYGADILPGDVIGSGTVGTGCFLELNGTGLLNDPNYKVQWLQEGDIVEMEIDALGLLKNTIRKESSDFSLLAIKKV